MFTASAVAAEVSTKMTAEFGYGCESEASFVQIVTMSMSQDTGPVGFRLLQQAVGKGSCKLLSSGEKVDVVARDGLNLQVRHKGGLLWTSISFTALSPL
jgi:hypothetical protein